MCMAIKTQPDVRLVMGRTQGYLGMVFGTLDTRQNLMLSLYTFCVHPVQSSLFTLHHRLCNVAWINTMTSLFCLVALLCSNHLLSELLIIGRLTVDVPALQFFRRNLLWKPIEEFKWRHSAVEIWSNNQSG